MEAGTLEQLRHLHRTTVTATLKAEPDGIRGLPGVHELTMSDRNVEFQVDADHLDDVLAKLSAIGVEALTSRPPTLEELFMRHYREDS